MADSPIPALIAPDRDALAFAVHGVTYTATDGLSVARLRVFDRLAQEFGADTTLRGLADDLVAIREALNKTNFVLAAAHLQRRLDALDLSGSIRLKDVELCGLFFNAPDEDAGAYEFAAMQAKCYAAWGAVHGGFFYPAALRLLGTSRGPYALLPDEAARLPTPNPSTGDL